MTPVMTDFFDLIPKSMKSVHLPSAYLPGLIKILLHFTI